VLLVVEETRRLRQAGGGALAGLPLPPHRRGAPAALPPPQGARVLRPRRPRAPPSTHGTSSYQVPIAFSPLSLCSAPTAHVPCLIGFHVPCVWEGETHRVAAVQAARRRQADARVLPPRRQADRLAHARVSPPPRRPPPRHPVACSPSCKPAHEFCTWLRACHTARLGLGRLLTSDYESQQLVVCICLLGELFPFR
jgi:hypothetical protein